MIEKKIKLDIDLNFMKVIWNSLHPPEIEGIFSYKKFFV